MPRDLPKIALVDSGEWGHASQNISFHPMLSAVQQACSVTIEAYGYTQATDVSNSDLDPKQKERRSKRQQVEKDRFLQTAAHFKFNDYDQWEKILNREPNIRALMIASQDGNNAKRLALIRQSVGIKHVLLMPPITRELQDAQKIASENGPPIITVWYPLRYARGILDAMEIINNGKFGDFGLASYAITFGTTSYPSLWSRAIEQVFDLLRHLIGEVEAFTLRAAGTLTRPSIAIATEHQSGVVGCLSVSGSRFLQRFPHTHIMLTGTRKLIVIDESGLRRCSYYDTGDNCFSPGFTHDTTPMEPAINLLNNWISSVKDPDKNKNPIPIADALNTMCLVTAVKTAIKEITSGTIKVDFQRRADGTYKVL